MNNEIKNTKSPLKAWLKRFGVAGFLFFLLKGIAWLVIAYIAGDAIF